MKYIFAGILTFIMVVGFAQQKSRVKPIVTIRTIFNEFKKHKESIDSDTNKLAMKNALLNLQQHCNNSDLPLLINVWMYYDATDFPTRSLINPIFTKNKKNALAAINKRLNHAEKWEDRTTAPYTDLVSFKKQLLQ